MANRLTIAVEASLGEILLRLWLGRRLPPLGPLVAPPSDPANPPSTLAGLWAAIDRLPRREQPLSGLRSTLLLARGSLAEKVADQYPRYAGRATPPTGFERLDLPSPGPDRPPLIAFFHPPDPGRPVLFLVHGLFDSKRTAYARRTAEALANLGYGILLPDLRWHGELLTHPEMATLGLAEANDLCAWAALLRDRTATAPFGLVGFSLGAMVVIQTLAADAAPVFSAGGVAISPAGDLRQTAEHLDHTPLLARPLGSGVMPWILRRGLRRRLQALGLRLPRREPFHRLLELFRRELGLATDLLAATDPCTALRALRRPTLVLSGENDPLFPPQTTDQLEAAAQDNPWVHVIRLPSGGHVGCLANSGPWVLSTLDLFFTASPGLGAA